MANLVGQNLRGKQITFKFNDVNKVNSSTTPLTLFYIDDQNYINISYVYTNSGSDGTCTYYYDDIMLVGEFMGMDTYYHDPVTITFPNDKDYIVTQHDEQYIVTVGSVMISGIWKIKDKPTLPSTSINQSGSFIVDDYNGLGEKITSIYIDSQGLYYRWPSYSYQVYMGGSTNYWYTSNTYMRYIQFGVGQEVAEDFYDWMENNATYITEGALYGGEEYCFRLNMSTYLQKVTSYTSYASHQFTLGFTSDKNAYTYIHCYVNYMYYSGTLVYHNNDNTLCPKEMPEFGWTTNSYKTRGFKSRKIKISQTMYLGYRSYDFMISSTIPLDNSKQALDTLGAYALKQDMATMAESCVKFAKYMKYTPVADTLYYNTTGTTSITGLTLDNYTYVTIRAIPSTTVANLAYPQATGFAVQNVKDCGTMTLQMSDNAAYVVWDVTTSSIALKSYSGSNYKIIEVIGYRWDKKITSSAPITPTYSYKYVKGTLSTPGKYFNNYYNSDYGTEFRVELNFRLTSLGVELANNTVSENVNWSIKVNSSGNVEYKQTYSGKSATMTWTNVTLTTNTWYSLSLYSNNIKSTDESIKGQFNLSVVPYGASHSYTTKSNYYMSQYPTTRTMYIGGDDVDLRGTILIKGTKYHSGVTNTQSIMDVNVDDATVGSTLNLTSKQGDYTLTGGVVYGVTA